MPRVDSSAVDRVDFTPETMTLDIWYKGGSRYSYFGVSEDVYAELMCASSIGGFVNARIKDSYPFEVEPRKRRFRPGP